MVGGVTYLAAFDVASPAANTAFADAYCKQRGGQAASAGVVRRGTLPAGLAARYPNSVVTYSPASGGQCRGAACAFVGVLECVPAGAAACPADAQGNIG